MKIEIIRVSGQREEQYHPKWAALMEICKTIGAEGLDTVNLRDGRVMIVDDTGMIDGKPINPEATKLYHAVCVPGNPFSIHGDVAIALDQDFA